LKTQEILAKKWALLRASPNGLWAVFAGFLYVFKFTGSAAPRLGGLMRCIERTFFVGINILISIKIRKNIKVDDYVFYLYVLKKDGKWDMNTR